MFYIKSDVITLRSIEMYGLVTVWTSMDDGSYWVILLMYGSHDMRHTGFHRLTVVNETPGFWGVTRATSAIRGSRVEVGACHDELCDPLAMDTTETGCNVGDCGPAH